MDMRFSAGLLWRRLLLAGAAVTLAACVTEMAEVQPAPTPAPPVVASPAPPPPAPTPVAPQAEQPRPVEAPPPPVTPPPVAAAPAPPPAPAALRGPVEVTGVDVRGEGAGGMTVVVTGDGPIPTYESFTLPDPPRLVLDIPNANHAIPQPIAAQSPAVKAIRSSQYRERPVKIVRLVIDLRSALPYRIETAGNQLRVQLGAPGGSDSTAQAAAPAPAAAPASTGKVTRVSVQNARGRQRILIGTSGRVAYNVTQSSDPPSLTVDVTGATIDTAAARSLDLRQVASSVSRLRASQYRTEPDQVVRIVADLRNPTRYEVNTYRFSSGFLGPLKNSPSLRPILNRSRLPRLGFRIEIEFSHSTRLCRAS